MLLNNKLESEKKQNKNEENIDKNSKDKNSIQINYDDEYLNKFISTKTFYKKALYLLYLITFLSIN